MQMISCFADCSVKTTGIGGGLVGRYIHSRMLSCYNLGRTNGENGQITLGGLYGAGNSDVYSCYNSGNIYINNLDKNYGSYIGGLIGMPNNNTQVGNSYNSGDIILKDDNAKTYVGGISARWK